MGRFQRPRRTGSGWSRRALALYWIFLAAVVIGCWLLNAAMRSDDRPVALAVVLTGVAFAVAMGLVLVVRFGRQK
jgi:hypothetical protein